MNMNRAAAAGDAGSMPRDAEWSTLYVYLHRSTADINAFLLREVAPKVRHLVRAGEATSWHFLRYWTGGPHLRIRLQGAADAAVAELAEQLRAAATRSAGQRIDLRPESFYKHFAESDALPWHDDATVLRAEYDPETRRYGGAAALKRVEQFFEASSEIALDVLAATQRDQDVRVVGVDFMLLALQCLGSEDLATLTSARNYFTGWDFNTESVTDAAAARRTAEAIYRAQPEQWNRRRDVLAQTIAGGAKTTHSAWAAALRLLLSDLEVIAARGELENDSTHILWSLVHMMNNRLGVQVFDERVAAWLVSLCFPRWRREEGFFGDGIGASDRQYLENSKYESGGAMATQAPRGAVGAVGAVGETAAQYALPFVPAPSPRMPAVLLTQALASRASAYGDYGSGLALDRLSSLLATAVGCVPEKDPPAEQRLWRRRAIPSPSAAYTVDTYVLARAVEGLEEGAYRYDAPRHGFEQLDRQPNDGVFRAISPLMGEVAEPPAVIAEATVPALLVLVADLGRLRRRYGLRALRLALLESGHIAQNIGLVAAALGMPSVHLSAYADDEVATRLHLDGVNRAALAVLPIGERVAPPQRNEGGPE